MKIMGFRRYIYRPEARFVLQHKYMKKGYRLAGADQEVIRSTEIRPLII